MGMLVYVCRWNFGDCTNNGISANHDTICVVNVEGPFKPSEKFPAVILEKDKYGTVRIVPAEIDETDLNEYKPVKRHLSFGGNYAAAFDSRFSDACKTLGCTHGVAIPIFDRIER